MIPFLDLTRQHTALQPELMDAVARVLASSRFVLGLGASSPAIAFDKVCILGVSLPTSAERLFYFLV
jgi:hypothetical protein